MNKVFARKYKKLKLSMIILFAVFACIFLWRPMVKPNFVSQGVVYVCLSIIMIGLILAMILYAVLDLKGKIVISDTTIMIIEPLKVIEINWQDIIEFNNKPSQKSLLAQYLCWRRILNPRNA